ncbi:pentatricopeptide repeat-containing protein At2g30780-like isoform X2 [Aristolochia californica]|uniref:pentatricopeptide repeat-containing protein At2g30780-like isoform X2 n=1 Tax=Aristolochia californica TaxID=171875 RepID=UPI0035D74286
MYSCRKLSSIAKSEISLIQRYTINLLSPVSPVPASTNTELRHFSSLGALPKARSFCSKSDALSKMVLLFSEKEGPISGINDNEELNKAVSDLAYVLVSSGVSDSEKITEILNMKGSFLLQKDARLSFVELLLRMKQWPQIGIEIFNWKRRQAGTTVKVIPEEYAKAINLAGRMKNLTLAFELFSEATRQGIQKTSIYNALMGAYVYNGLTDQSLILFENLKKDPKCEPTIVTFNILLSAFGLSMMVKDMEMVMAKIREHKLTPNIITYNALIAGYITAWMWGDMERTFLTMQQQPIIPNTRTYLLMLRGYALSGNLQKMEATYELVRDHVNEKCIPLIRSMICAYCKSSDGDRAKKIEVLLKLIPEDEYRPWLNALLIRLYAQEDLVEQMENNIDIALQRNTSLVTLNVMRAIVASYFRCNALDKLIWFVKHAEYAGWRLCRSLYHCKMVMYGCQDRFEEMEDVLGEMINSRFCPTKKTFLIMYKAYLKGGQDSKVKRLLGLMFKQGYGIPVDASVS